MKIDDKRRLWHINRKSSKVLKLESKFEKMSDDELKIMTSLFRKRLADGATLTDLYPAAFAVAREACRRVTGKFPYPVQIMGATVLQEGDIAEMKTGEGKTLTAVMAVYLKALEGKGVHVVTVNEYLSQRDARLNGDIFRFLGLTVGVNKKGMSVTEKQKAYACDVTYTTSSELGFDYLRDNLVKESSLRVLRGLHYALIDETDSILIDEARTPLIISGGEKKTANLYLQTDRFVKQLKAGIDYEVDIRSRTVQLTDTGSEKAERAFRVDNLYTLNHADLLHCICQALKANYIMIRDVDYVVHPEDDEVLIIDPNTGRFMKGRQWSDGLHQAVEAKENISIHQETSTLATITYQNFFRLYSTLSGMTGTAKTDEEEFLDTFNMAVVPIPTHKQVIRNDMPDMVFGSKKAKFEALVEEVRKRHATGQPVLVGTIAVETSEHISSMLNKAGIPHNVLNANNNEHEAEIIACAGLKGAVTIATNMAGRGTDIQLGDGVRELGGLCVIGSERHESRRIDNQLRGRAGRQGDPGVSVFYVSVEYDLMKRFGSERMEKVFNSLGDEYVQSKSVSRSIMSAQQRVEGVNYDARKSLMQYDDVMGMQRETVYHQRNYILEQDNIHQQIGKMFFRVIGRIHDSSLDENGTLNIPEFVNKLNEIGFGNSYSEKMVARLSPSDVVRRVATYAWDIYNIKIETVQEKAFKLEKTVALTMIDRAWATHINTMNNLKNGIGLRSYAQSNPFQAYSQEGHGIFDNMMNAISKDIVSTFVSLKIVSAEKTDMDDSVHKDSSANRMKYA